MFKIINGNVLLYTIYSCIDGVDHIYDGILIEKEDVKQLMASLGDLIVAKRSVCPTLQNKAAICYGNDFKFIELNYDQITSFIDAIPHLTRYI